MSDLKSLLNEVNENKSPSDYLGIATYQEGILDIDVSFYKDKDTQEERALCRVVTTSGIVIVSEEVAEKLLLSKKLKSQGLPFDVVQLDLNIYTSNGSIKKSIR